MTLTEFKTKKINEFLELRDSCTKLFPIDLREKDLDFTDVIGDLVVIIDKNNVIIDVDDEEIEVEVVEMNVEDIDYIIHLLQDLKLDNLLNK